MDEESILMVENVSKVYESRTEKTVALFNVSFQLERAGFLAVLGPSGSGKTTLLALLGGLDRPSSGRILFGGFDLSSLDEKRLSEIRRRRIGMVFQNYNLVDELTLVENVELPLLFDGRPRNDTRKHALDLLERVGLSHRSDRRPFQLSSGEQQRAAAARALVTGPSLVLMDEPTGNLDQENSMSLMSIVKALNQEKGTAFVIATHSTEIANQAKSRILLKAGRLESNSLPS